MTVVVIILLSTLGYARLFLSYYSIYLVFSSHAFMFNG